MPGTAAELNLPASARARLTKSARLSMPSVVGTATDSTVEEKLAIGRMSSGL
jgi:hypothetical protein